jgi:hypothetical protein
MKLHFNNSTVDIVLNTHCPAFLIQRMYQHLQHLPINFKSWDNPYYLNVSQDQLISTLVKFGQQVGVDIDYQRCLIRDQSYFNEIHKIYEQQYDGNSQWTDFHEFIHLCEKLPTKAMVIDYREKSGLLEKKFDLKWMKDTTTHVFPGDVYVSWSELGKIPYIYWKNLEPNSIDRLCQLAKPWLKLRPKLSIALEEVDFISQCNVQEFNQWWANYKHLWCQHWNIPSWNIEDMMSVSVVGHIADIDLVKSKLQQGIVPTQISL